MELNVLKLAEIRAEAGEAISFPPYQAMNGLWVCLVKLSNLLPTVGEEHEQVASLLRRFTRQQAGDAIADDGVERLLRLDPPLETVLADQRERLCPLPAARELTRIRKRRFRDPKAALAALFQILQRIRDKREHGFKTPSGPRDAEILEAAVSILKRLCRVAIENLGAASAGVSPNERAQRGS